MLVVWLHISLVDHGMLQVQSTPGMGRQRLGHHSWSIPRKSWRIVKDWSLESEAMARSTVLF